MFLSRFIPHQSVEIFFIAQALLVQSALTAMSRQSKESDSKTQHAPAGERQQQLSSTEASQSKAEHDADLAAAAERAQRVRAHRLVHIKNKHHQGIPYQGIAAAAS